MIDSKTILSIRHAIHHDNMTHKDAAKKFKVSRGAVNLAASGAISREGESVSLSCKDTSPPTGQYVRCPGCGGMVQMPCLSCYMSNGEEYPDCVVNAAFNPAETKTTRTCIRCRLVLPIERFGNEHSEEGGSGMVYSTCYSCRAEIEHDGRSNFTPGERQ
jgi:hypothetical protein